MGNLAIFTKFLLMDISTSREFQFLQVLMFLVIYMRSLTGNLLTLTVIVINSHLHSPMYFFIGNLSIIDICYISVTLPKMIVNSLIGNTSISQIFLFIFSAATELAFLVVMSYDPNVAICHSLHYGLTITACMCRQAPGGSWAGGMVYSAIHTGNIFRLSFTKSNMIHQYFCDVPQILRIYSSDVQFSEFMCVAISTCIILACSGFLFKSFIGIFSMVLRMHSVEACNKALPTCTPQLAILILFVICLLTVVFGPNTSEASLSNLLIAMFSTTVPPFTNPIICSLWNRKINIALHIIFKRYFEFPSRFLKSKNSEKN